MDMQGTPIGSTNQGMKNTTDPRSSIPTQEGAGPVAADSLAAESTRAGGKFSENRDSAPMAAKGSQSTLNNTDTSAATTLAPAADAQERDANEAKTALQETSSSTAGFSGTKADSGSSGAKADSGSSGATSDFGSSTQQKSSASHTTGDNTGESTTAQSSSGSSAGAAPSYVSSVASDAAKSGKPHGKNITEGGFDSDDSKNASFNSEIGGENDPGRAAENQFQRQTLESGNDAAPGVPRQKGVSDDGQFDVLETEQSL